MADSFGGSFPGKGINTGHVHQSDIIGGIYRYLGDDPADIDVNWILIGGELLVDPDTSSWGVRQDGARWFNKTSNNFKGWNGTSIVLLDIAAAGSSYGTIQNNGIALTQQDTINIIGRNVITDDNNSTTRIRIEDSRTMSYIKDDFYGVGIVDNTIGQLRWEVTTISVSNTAGTSDHPGILQLLNTFGTGVLELGVNTGISVLPASIFDIEFIAKLTQTDANTGVKFGLMFDPATLSMANGIFIEKKPADSSFFGVTRGSSTESRTAALLASDTDWHSFRCRRIDSSTIGFSIDQGTELTLTTNIPTAAMHPAIQFNSLSGTKLMQLDKFDLLTSGLTR